MPLEMKVATPVQIQDKVFWMSLRTNLLEKGLKPYVFPLEAEGTPQKQLPTPTTPMT